MYGLAVFVMDDEYNVKMKASSVNFISINVTKSTENLKLERIYSNILKMDWNNSN